MAAWEQTSPMIKFEDSPAESFVSTPGELYPSLFGDAAPLAADDTTINPSDMLTPPPFTEDNPVSTPDTDSPPSEKKPVKKRKSWGQVLPEPKTNLPPRKRAKTEDEKEQRRVERVLRNRRAAQSSRERKRLEVEALERRNKELEAALSNVTKANQLLVEELNKFRRDSGMLTRSSSPLDPLRSNSVTLSPELFGSQDGHRPSIDETKNLVDDLMTTSHSNPTVNPASLSPELSPIAENDEADAEDNEVAETNVKTSSDLTQLGGPSAIMAGLSNPSASDLGLLSAASDAVNHIIGDSFSLSAALDTDRYVLESGLLSSPNSLDYEHDYLAGDSTAFLQDPFDISEFLNDEVNGSVSDTHAVIGTAVAADPDYGRDSTNSETQVSSENLNLQPHSGASTYGCDDGGIAVGV
ncbi:Transcriptional activator hac1 [Colletotrichum gloeosporioides]|uniref:Transcriptional activator hac1 n=1 Tax=Colletotrichum gloeosporioides TaxID=474922 RepID=A0A8H4C5M5_COLGL|nr:Transcriptional activator hac1 [Colletotrichum gloeosporioides]KAF3797641.1 Transcriptional activator hac1 [Colletotrichum gloeosporioides]